MIYANQYGKKIANFINGENETKADNRMEITVL